MPDLKWLETFNLLLLDEIDSTNQEAKRIALSGEGADHLVIVSKSQTKGRGRSGKVWESQEGNMFLSILLPRTQELESMSQLSFVTSLALGDAISELFKQHKIARPVELKWPNDVMIDNKKVAGILIESTGLQNEYIIVGVGVNIKNSPEIQGRETTNLYDQGLQKEDYNDIMCRFMTNFVERYNKWLTGDFLSIREKWLEKAKNLGEIITVDTGSAKISGKFMDIDFKGQIRICVSSGQIHSINTGEVFFGQ